MSTTKTDDNQFDTVDNISSMNMHHQKKSEYFFIQYCTDAQDIFFPSLEDDNGNMVSLIRDFTKLKTDAF